MVTHIDEIENIASEIYRDIEGSMSDYGGGNEIEADRLWDDVEFLRDVVGDKIHDATGHFNTTFAKIKAYLVALEIRGIGHEPMKKAIDIFIKYHKLDTL